MPITLGKRQWVYLAAIVIALLVIVSLAFQERIYAAYLHQFVGPELQKDFRFKVGTERIIEGKEPIHVFVIESVEARGILAQAGFQSGDIPVGYKHGFESGFYQDLLWAKKGRPIEMAVVNISDARRGNWQARKITLHRKLN
jgi:hypothetical protein